MTINEIIRHSSTPTEIKTLFQEIVSDYDNQKSRAWLTELYLNQTGDRYKLHHHTKRILKQGKVLFDKPTHKLTSKEIILLYKYYYFPMHFTSSFWLYDKYYSLGFSKYLTNTNPIFIDFGCGTFTSAVALSSVIKKHILPTNSLNNQNIHNQEEFGIYYIGIDNSKSVLIENREFLRLNQSFHSLWNCHKTKHEERYTDFFSIVAAEENNKVFEIIDEYIINRTLPLPYKHTITNGISPINYKNIYNNEFVIILNFSYLFGSDSLVVDELVNFVNQLIIKYSYLKICAFYQNTTHPKNNRNWHIFKEKVHMKSILPKHQTASIQHYKYSDGVLYDVLIANIANNG